MVSRTDAPQRRYSDDSAMRRRAHIAVTRAFKNAPAQAEDGLRQIEGIDAHKDALVLVMLPIIAGFGIAWAALAATLDWTVWRKCIPVYGTAGAFLFLSFLAACGYFMCRNKRATSRLLSLVLVSMMLRPTLQAVDEILEPEDTQSPDLKELNGATGELAKSLDEQEKSHSYGAQTCFDLMWGFLVFAVGFFLAWLCIKARI